MAEGPLPHGHPVLRRCLLFAFSEGAPSSHPGHRKELRGCCSALAFVTPSPRQTTGLPGSPSNFFPRRSQQPLGRTQTWGSGPMEADENPDSEVKASSTNLEVFRLNIWEEAMTHQTREYVQHQVGPEEISVFFLGVSSETQVGLSQRPCCSSH